MSGWLWVTALDEINLAAVLEIVVSPLQLELRWASALRFRLVTAMGMFAPRRVGSALGGFFRKAGLRALILARERGFTVIP
jgi:hypothetical protein